MPKQYRLQLDGWVPPVYANLGKDLSRRRAREQAMGRMVLASIAYGCPLADGKKRTISYRVERPLTPQAAKEVDDYMDGLVGALFDAGLIPDEKPRFLGAEVKAPGKRTGTRTIVFLTEDDGVLGAERM